VTAYRRTLLVPSRTAWAHERLAAARRGDHGLEILTLPQAAARLAGGFVEAVRSDSLQALVGEALQKLELPEIGSIADLPGTSRAVVRTLRKAWAASVNLAEMAGHSGRIRDLAEIERYALEHLPPATRTPPQLVTAALEHIGHAPKVLGPITVRGLLDPDPCWRPVLSALAETVPFAWHQVPGTDVDLEWLAGAGAQVVAGETQTPEERVVRCADPRHEAVEALRWARALVASRQALPGEIALAATRTSEWDEDLETAAAAGALPLHFARGRRALSTFPGQQAAALADLLARGLTRSRALRVLRLCRRGSETIGGLPNGWHRVLPSDAILQRTADWKRALDGAAGDGFVEGVDPRPALLPLIELLEKGFEAAAVLGPALLSGVARTLWEQALRLAPAEALPTTLAELRLPDESDPTTSILWVPAHELVGSPRPYVRLLGMTRRGWPRVGGEDPLLPDHVSCTRSLDATASGVRSARVRYFPPPLRAKPSCVPASPRTP
jgi:hypothetical protein